MDEPRRGFDPLALAVNGVAVVAMLAIGGYLAISLWLEKPAPPPPKPVVAKPAPPTPRPETKSAPQARTVVGDIPPAPAELMAQYGAGRKWHYHVEVEPRLWRDATLIYRMRDRGGDKVVDTDFRYADGGMQFHLGTFAAGHPSHANTRFPGFFMYAAYLNRPLNLGERFSWEWPWQLPDGSVRPGRVKRYTAEVKEWTSIPAPRSMRAPMDQFPVARIEVRLAYVEDGVERFAAKETVWYAWRYLQVAKIVREGKTPDEAAHRIVADLVEHIYQ